MLHSIILLHLFPLAAGATGRPRSRRPPRPVPSRCLGAKFRYWSSQKWQILHMDAHGITAQQGRTELGAEKDLLSE